MDTATVRTDPVMPGEHWLFRHIEGVRNGASKLAPGIDVRGSGGYVCFPPSPGYSVIHEADIAPWPDWLLPLVVKVAEPAPRPEPSSYATPVKVSDNRLRGFIDREVRRVRDAPNGGRHNARLAAARSIGGVAAEAGLSDAEAEEMLIAARPPEVEEEKERKTIRDGLAYGRAEPIDLNTLPDSAQFRGHWQHHGNGADEQPDPQWHSDTRRDEETAEAEEEDAAKPRRTGRPVIEVRGGTLPYMVAEAEAALLAGGVAIYQRAILVRPTEQQLDAADGRKTHSAVLVPVTAPYLLKLLAKVAYWRKYDGRKKKLVACNPPNDVVNILLASRGDWAFPVIRGVITCPTLRPDGSLLTMPGYDSRTRYYLALPAGLTLPHIPDRPSREEAEAALARLDTLLDGFPFEDEVSRAVALATLMTPVLRVAMDMSPLLAVSAKSPGTGKSFLVDLATTIALGRFCPVMGPGKNEEETEKRIDTNLISGMPVFSIDNVHRPLDLVTLNTATERPLLTIRLFGTLTNVEVENSVTIFMTGNNLAIVGEQGRRTVRACMDAKVEQPEQRDFPLGDPIEAVLQDRGRYIADVLTIARAYHVSGAPRPTGLNPFGSYPGWSHFVREALVWLGQPDPIASQEAARADDPATIKLRAVIDAWHGAFGIGATTLAKAAQYATTPPIHPGSHADDAEMRAYHAHKAHQEGLLAALREAFRGISGPGAAQIDTVALGNWMRAFDGRMADGMRFEKAKDKNGKVQHDHGAVMWKLAKP
jgi:hypothetical protein